MGTYVEIRGVEDLPIITKGDDIAKLIYEAVLREGNSIQDGDVVVIAHIIVSRAEGQTVNLEDVIPSKFAIAVAKESGKDPALVEVVLQESKSIIRMSAGKLITETKHGFICANSGVDKSNVAKNRTVALLPKNPDLSAKRIRQGIRRSSGKDIAVIISDTHGRALREGEINIAIGISGITPIRDRKGEKDLFGKSLKIKRTAIADELCSAAELIIGQADEARPVAIIRGYHYPKSEKAKATKLIRPRKKDLFI